MAKRKSTTPSSETPNNNGNGNANVVGKGKITPNQVAFIVDRYLADNHFDSTRSSFRSEASSLLPKSSLHQAPKTLLSLGNMLDEYIWLKEQKVMLDQEKHQLEQEKFRVQTLLQGMQDVMNAYNSSSTPTPSCIPPPPPASMPSSSAGYHAYRTPVMTSVSVTQSMKLDHTNFSTPITTSCPRRKRKNYKDLQDALQAPKKICPQPSYNQLSYKGSSLVVQVNDGSNSNHKSSTPDFADGGVVIQGSNVAKNLFNKTSRSPTSNSPGPKTPPRATSSQSDKSISPIDEVSSTVILNDSTPPETTPTNCTIISSKTIIVSPVKRISIETNHCSFSSPSKLRQTKRDHVKGRLDFDGSDLPTNLDNTSSGDGSSTSESEKEADIFDLDFPNLDTFGPDFSLTELLTDFGIDCESFDYTCGTDARACMDVIPESLGEAKGTSQASLEHSSAVKEVFAGDTNQKGSDSISSMKSVTKCIRIVSPAKSSRSG